METLIYFSDFFREVGLANTFSFVFIVLIFGFAVYYFPMNITIKKQKIEQEEKNVEFFREQINFSTRNSSVIESLQKTVESLQKTIDTISKSNEKIITKLSVHDATYQASNGQLLSMIESNNDIGDKILEKDSKAQTNIEHISEEIRDMKEKLEKVQEYLAEIKVKIKIK